MFRNPRNLLWLLPLLLFVTSPLWYDRIAAFLKPPGTFNPKLTQTHKSAAEQHFVMNGVVITTTSHGEPEWRIDAQRAFTGEEPHEIVMNEVKSTYIGKKKEPILIESRKGDYRTDTRYLILSDQVKIVKPQKNQVLLTDRLDYNDATKKLVSPGKTWIKSKDMTIDAGRLNYDFSTEGAQLDNRVKVVL